MKSKFIYRILGVILIMVLLISAIPRNKHYWMQHFTIDMSTMTEDSLTYYISVKNTRSYPEVYYKTTSLDTTGTDAEIKVMYSLLGGDGSTFFEADNTKFPIILNVPDTILQVESNVAKSGVFYLSVVKNSSTSGALEVFFQLSQ